MDAWKKRINRSTNFVSCQLIKVNDSIGREIWTFDAFSNRFVDECDRCVTINDKIYIFEGTSD